MISGCRGLCTTLSAACIGYSFVVSSTYTVICVVFGSTLPDKGTGAAAAGQELGGWEFYAGTGGSDKLTGGSGHPGYECYAKQPGASGMHPPIPHLLVYAVPWASLSGGSSPSPPHTPHPACPVHRRMFARPIYIDIYVHLSIYA